MSGCGCVHWFLGCNDREFAATEREEALQDFTKWAETYGPIYSIRTGASTLVVFNSTDVPEEAMVTRHSSISLRKLLTALKILTFDNALVAASYYKDFSQDGKTSQMFLEPMLRSEGVLEVDWRDLFPHLRRWVPNNNSLEMKIQDIYFRRKAVMNSLIKEQTNRIASGEEVNSFLDYLLCEAKTLTMEHITIFVWEAILEAADTTLVTTEWATYELAKDQNRQGLLYEEIKNVCGSDKITEEHLSQLPYLNAVFHETLRKHSPASVALLRYAHEDTQLGGYYIPAGTEVALNIYGCNRDKNEWESPEEWKPERFLWTRRNVIQRIFTRPWRLELERGPALVLFRQC
ncbi:ent-kaurene oxidase chloroplastic-like [Prunus yedoensis var. nudiflora]|uniref:Ent-kaurene oxidase chloroplastic-like n=1 Tax=Prunus yedoensis var. nudiflora TaxID=2094558 RepID=A0A314UQ14_PRUYE|nr:ent-kaurene oxidase chloroplastic-like [Prunus yedoensis var. nudiflora]